MKYVRGLLFGLFCCLSCSSSSEEETVQAGQQTYSDALRLDPQTGIPYATVFQFPLAGFDASDFGFGFGGLNDHFCLSSSHGECLAYGAHLGRDSQVKKTPVGTPVFSPADGIVRLTTSESFGGYGSDSRENSSYAGCLILIEHEFANGQPIVSLLGHVQCEGATPYDPDAQRGNPRIGNLVRRGQYIGHVASYWSGSTKSVDWHHLHWGMRKGPYDAKQKTAFVEGYALPSSFRFNAMTHAKEHDTWVDPFVIVAANGDPGQMAAMDVRFHPPGSLLVNEQGAYFLVQTETQIAALSDSVALSDRYDVVHAVRVSDQELACYSLGQPLVSQGSVLLYRRPNTSTVVFASKADLQRQDFIRWEALLSWGFTADDVQLDIATALAAEVVYVPQSGFKRMRPGSLVKAETSSEVCVVRPDGFRQPIASADVFEALGFSWEQVYVLPEQVLDAVAGVRLNEAITWQQIHICAWKAPCSDGKNCGGGADPCSLFSCPMGSLCVLSMDGKPYCQLSTPSQPVCMGECIAGLSEPCTACVGVQGVRTCSTVTCQWSACQKPAVAEQCADEIDNDCNGLVDCLDPACVMQSVCMPDPNPYPNPLPTDAFPLRLQYVGEKMAGSIVLRAWWQPPMDAPRAWAAVTECIDTLPGDGLLDCTIALPHGTTSFEFQLDLPNGGYWGDTSCYVKGGCGQPNGVVTLSRADTAESVSYELIPNVPGEPYLKGHVSWIP